MANQKGQLAQKTQPNIRNDISPDLIVEKIPIANLILAKHPVRKTSSRQIAKAKSSFSAYGVVRPILIASDKEIIDGHVVVEAARELGLKSVPCIRISHLDERQVRGLRIALNKIQETGTWDEPALKLELAYQLEFNTDLTVLGFEGPELDNLFEISVGAGDGPDPVDDVGQMPEPNAPAVAKLGDVWILGDHQIYCGNGRDIDSVLRLFGSRTADMVFTDPPFNVPVNGHVRVVTDRFEEFAEASGEMTPEEFTEFLSGFIVAVDQVTSVGTLIYCFMDWRHMEEMQGAIRTVGFELLNLCVWVKPNGGMGSFYRSRHELVFVIKKPGAPHTNNVELGRHGRYRTNVWEYAGATGGARDEADDFALHPTVKPVRLVEDAIRDGSALGQTVFDPFLGSGTTLLAAERTGRHCIGVEISPAYVDVAIRRWQDLTRRQAVHKASGQTFAERAAALDDIDASDLASGLTTGTVTGTTSGTSWNVSREDF